MPSYLELLGWHVLGISSLHERFSRLSPRELEVLEALSAGLRYQEIADQLGIDKSTVASHLHHIYEKLHVRSATAATARYLDRRKRG